ncbi:hypothetical protein [Streptomyces sp. A5-4]|uniref:hypothetical protein n=1 Tax=Streptomyces sp. A5-4 TaxID=3384771 RepID=UPI003DA9C145
MTGGRAEEQRVQAAVRGHVRTRAAAVVTAAFDQAASRDPGHTRCWVVLVDGDRHQIELIEAEAKRRQVTVHLVADLIHALEYLWKAARWSRRGADANTSATNSVKSARRPSACRMGRPTPTCSPTT